MSEQTSWRPPEWGEIRLLGTPIGKLNGYDRTLVEAGADEMLESLRGMAVKAFLDRVDFSPMRFKGEIVTEADLRIDYTIIDNIREQVESLRDALEKGRPGKLVFIPDEVQP